MTQVQEEKTEGLKRAFTVTVPRDEIEAAKTKRLEQIAKSAKIQGFRPGKAPLNLIRQRFEAQVESEVMDQVINDNTSKLLKDKNLRPAMQPKLDLVDVGEGKDLVYKVDLEILPEIKPMDFSSLSFEKQVADVADKTVDEAIERIAKSMRQPEAISEKRAVAKGEVAVIDFDGTVDGVAHDGMKSENHVLELGSNSFIEGFEDQIVGMKVGDKKDVKVKFPEAYHAAHLAGKDAVFAVALKEIRAHKPVELDDALGKEIGFPSLQKLRDRVSGDIGNNYAQISRSVLKRELMDVLAQKHNFELPDSLVEAEFANIWKQIEQDKKLGRLDADDAKKSEDQLKKDYREIAGRRVCLGLLLAHVAEANKIEVTPAELRTAMMAEARRYPGQEQAVVEYYTKTRGAIEHLRAPILEEKVVDFILSQAKITEKKIDAEKLLKLPEEMD
ncbi:MAG: trigger factor [Proteobacteria bacterium]|jgi:trigger factor|nr:trigger factor [Alphaproteobacteria bacterium]NCC02788.1 trigger factor [Pseudomonadota bacterium]